MSTDESLTRFVEDIIVGNENSTVSFDIINVSLDDEDPDLDDEESPFYQGVLEFETNDPDAGIYSGFGISISEPVELRRLAKILDGWADQMEAIIAVKN